MKKLITLAAAGTLAATAFNAQAQMTVDGVLNATEIGAANTGKYVLIGKYTNPRGFGDYGLLSLYAANTGNKIYFFVAGTVQNDASSSNSFQLFLDLPGVAGASASPTALPAGAGGTTFSGIAGIKLDIAPDMGLAIKGNGTGVGGNAGTIVPQAVIYTSATAAVDRDLAPELPNSGAAVTVAATSSATPFTRLAGARMAYRNSVDGKITTNPGNTIPNTAATYGAAGSFGWEIELDRTALQVTAPGAIGVFVVQNNGGGDYLSTDFIPQTTSPVTTNGGNLANANAVDFATVAGLQRGTFNVVALGSRAADEASVAMNVYPNPASSQATVAYRVLDRAQNVNIVLTDLMGRQVRVLENSAKAAGTQTVSFNTSDVAAGSYLVRVQVGDKVATRKVVLL